MTDATDLSDKSKLASRKVSMMMKKCDLKKEKNSTKRKLIEAISKSNTNLEKKLENITSNVNCQRDKEQMKAIKVLVKQVELIDDKLKSEKAYLTDLEEQIHQVGSNKLIKRNATFRKKMKQGSGDPKTIEKSKEVLQEKLHVESVHLSDELTKNAELREKIRSLMNNRAVFNKEYDGVLEKLKCGKKVMEDITKSVKNTALLRENILNKLEQIHLKENKQKALQEKEAFDLQVRKENEEDLRLFDLCKNKDRRVILEMKKEHKSSVRSSSGLAVLEQYNALTEHILNISFSGKPKSFLNERDIIIIIQKNDSEISSLLTFLTQQNHELEALTQKVLEHANHVEELSLEQEENNLQHEDVLKQLDNFYTNIIDEHMRTSDELVTCRRDVNKLYKGIENLINISKADVSPLLLLLGENAQVTDFNYNLFLQALETKVVSILEELNLPKYPLKQLWDRTKNVDIKKSQYTVESKVTKSSPCEICYFSKLART